MSAGAESGHVESSSPHGRTYPLNSGRLTGAVVARIAQGLGLPHSALVEETQQMIEGKLSEGRESHNVLVEQTGAAAAMVISLRDDSGVFLRLEPEIEPDHESRGGEPGDGVGIEEEIASDRAPCEGDEMGGGSLRRLERELEGVLHDNARLSEENEGLRGMNAELLDANEGLKGANTELTKEVTRLKDSLGVEKERHRAEWRNTCQQFIEYDDLLRKKEKLISDLQHQLKVLRKDRDRSGEELISGEYLPGAESEGGSPPGDLTTTTSTVPASSSTPSDKRRGLDLKSGGELAGRGKAERVTRREMDIRSEDLTLTPKTQCPSPARQSTSHRPIQRRIFGYCFRRLDHVLPTGMGGVVKRSCCNWLATCVEERYRNGICSKTLNVRILILLSTLSDLD